MKVSLEVAPVFEPLLERHRYLCAWGGRGSGKSRLFAALLVVRALAEPGFRAVCIREVQLTLKDSSKRLIEDTINELGVGSSFEVLHDQIKTPGDGVIIFKGMSDSNAENIKSLENFSVAWVEEAQSLSARSLSLLRPTIRTPGSSLWFSWNPRRKSDPVDMLFRGAEIPTDAVVVRANYEDNPWFPQVLEQERQDCLRMNPEEYPHIWQGEYMQILAGAYYAKSINEAKLAGRIGKVAPDPLLPYKLSIDIGGTGATSDAFAIWVTQDVGMEVRVLDCYEAQGQPLATHLEWMRSRGYRPSNSQIYLPHDGVQQDKVYAVSYESALRDAGYDVTVVKNQGRGAAMARVEAARRLFPSCWFNDATTSSGIDALGWYHERRDESRQVGLGPEHDWSSHLADAFGLMAVVAEQRADRWDRHTQDRVTQWRGTRADEELRGYSRG
jgi:phage terminase large subunit